jgi:hypothetical protein
MKDGRVGVEIKERETAAAVGFSFDAGYPASIGVTTFNRSMLAQKISIPGLPLRVIE